MKRLFDIILVIISLSIFLIPIFIIFLSIRLSGGGSAIYSQERIGYKGKPFILYKFRTMKNNAEMDGIPLLFFNNDPRLTSIGRFLRVHHLDEFPQLWNILRGDMSFVGPRPERKFFIEQIIQQRPDYVRLYSLRPGLFSKATLYNGYTDTIEKMYRRLDMDLEYLDSHSIWEDIRIIFLTATAIIIGKNF